MDLTIDDLRVMLVLRRVKQADVAARIGMDETHVSKILNGRRAATDDFVSRFAAAVEELARESEPVSDPACEVAAR